MTGKINTDDILMLNYVTMGTEQNGIIKKPIKAFGKNALGFEKDGEFMNFIIDTRLDPADYIDVINELVEKMQDCREEIEEFFFPQYAKWVLDENNTEILNTWYNTLEVISGLIMISMNRDIFIEYLCKDCIYEEEYYLGYTKENGFYRAIED